jgi:hypothetical protein
MPTASSALRTTAVRCLAALAWLAPAVALAAEPLLVPEFTPASPSDFALAGMLGAQVRDRLLADGHIVLTEEIVSPVVGQALQNCAARPGCPSDVLPRIPARLAVVTLVGRAPDGQLIGYVRLFVGADPRPALGRDLPIAPGQESLFADQVSGAVRELLGMVGPSPDAVLMAAARLISGQGLPNQPAPRPAPVAPVDEDPTGIVIEDLDTPATEPGRPAPVSQPRMPATNTTGVADTRPLGEILGDTGVMPRHVTGSEKSLRNAGVDPRDWVYKNSPHAGRLTVDVQAGLGIGDVERGADLRVTIDADGTQIENWFQEGPYYARRPRGGLFVGYAPATMIDLGLFFGLQYSNRVLTTGLARQQSDGTTEIITNAPQRLQALQVLLQPRVRAYVVPLGPAKPYLFTAPEFRVFDAYKLDQGVDPPQYPIPTGGTMFGWCGGGGLMVDPGPIVGLFAEGSYTYLFGTRTDPQQSGVWSSPTPAPPVPTHYTVAISGGVQFRI